MNNNTKLFENETQYSTNDYVQFLRFHGKKFNFSYVTYTLFWGSLLFLCLILAFGTGARLQGVSITIVLILFIGYRFARPRMIVNNELNSDKFGDSNVNTFSFYEKEFEVLNKNGSFNYKYFMLYRIYETRDFFYLYVTKENAFLVSKYAFSLGTERDFAAFMKVRCKSKYKIDNEKKASLH